MFNYSKRVISAYICNSLYQSLSYHLVTQRPVAGQCPPLGIAASITLTGSPHWPCQVSGGRAATFP